MSRLLVILALAAVLVMAICSMASAQVFPTVTLSSFDQATGTYVYTVTCQSNSTYPLGYLQIDTQMTSTGSWTMSGPVANNVNKNWPIKTIRWDGVNLKDSAIWDPTLRGTEIPANTAWTGVFTLVVPNSIPVPGFASTRDGQAASFKVHSVMVPGPKPSAPPVTEFSVEGDTGQNDWYITPVKVSLFATDPDNDYDYTLYSLDDIDWFQYETETPVELNDDGVYNLLAKSVDTFLNWELEAKTLQLCIDKTAPAISGVTSTKPNANGWYNADVQIDYMASDATSGLQSPMEKAATEATTFSNKISTEGVGLSDTASATDKAGNTSSVTVDNIKIDKTAPVITLQSAPEGCVHRRGFRFWRYMGSLLRCGVDESTDADFYDKARANCGDDGPDECSRCRKWHLIHQDRAVIRFTVTDSLSGIDGLPWVDMTIDPLDDRHVVTTPPVTIVSLGAGLYQASFDMTIPGEYQVSVHVKDMAGNVADLVNAAAFKAGGFWVNWLPPMCLQDTYVMEDGSTIPVKFRLKDPCHNNVYVNNYNYTVKVVRNLPDGSEQLMGVYTPKYDYGNGGYIVNVQSKDSKNVPWPVGDYTVSIEGPGIWDQIDGPFQSHYGLQIVDGGSKSKGRGRR